MHPSVMWCGLTVGLIACLVVPATGQANTTPGPSQSAPGSVSASGPAPAAGPVPAPGTPPPQPAGYPQVSMPYDIRNPSSSDDLPIAGPLAPGPINKPEQIHLAYAGSTPGSYGGQQAMYFSWNTGPVQQRLGPVTLPNVSCTPSIVKYGLTPTTLTLTASGSATAYTQLYVPQFGFEQNYSSASIHHVKVQNLLPNTRYFYQVGDGSAANSSPVLNFTTAPVLGTYPFRLVLFADLGQSENSSSTVDHMQVSLANDPYFAAAAHLVYVSDYSYADSYQSNGTDTALIPSSVRHQNFQAYQPRDDSFGQFIAPLTQQYPFMGSQGNHEIHLQGDNVTNFQSWLHRWVFPWRESGSPSPFFYSYDYGAAHIISLSNYVSSMLGNLMEEYEEDSMPLLWFNSIGEFWFWLIEWAIPGMGMFCEAYFIFSIGNVKQIISTEYPLCFTKYVTCDKTTTQVPDYMQIIGIVFGMITMGYIGDTIGRKWGSVMTVCIMSVGAILLTALNGTSEKGFVIMYIVSQFVFGYGVGGEYPMAAGSAAERAEAGGKAMAKKRGREVVLTFSMQGVGNFTNTAVLVILICCFNQIRPGVGAGRAGAGYYVPKNPSIHLHPKMPFTTVPANVYSYKKATPGAPPKTANLTYNYRPNALSGIWRISFGLGLLPLLFMIYWRIFHLKESVVWRQQSNEKRSRNIGKICTMFGSRLLATCGCWFLWDFSFYGNKVFQSTFIGILTPGGASLLTNLLWTLLNSGIALIGYWAAAFLIDDIYYGRLRMQLIGFIFVAALFYVGAGAYIPLTKAGGIHAFQFIYFFSSFWGQFGPNCTTFLLAGELYPTDARTTCHGFSAGVAKLGALWASIWFNYLGNRNKFWATSTFNVAGAILTLICLPDPLRVSLTELDRRWRYALAGKVYHGEAINPKSLSMWERLCRVGHNYDRNADEEDRLRDLMEESGGNGALPYQGKAMPQKEAAVV